MNLKKLNKISLKNDSRIKESNKIEKLEKYLFLYKDSVYAHWSKENRRPEIWKQSVQKDENGEFIDWKMTRFKRAEEQASMRKKSKEDIVTTIKKFLKEIHVNTIENPILNLNFDIPIKIDEEGKKQIDFNYETIMIEDQDDVGDLVWIKFTTDGFVGVVADSDDINFTNRDNNSRWYSGDEFNKCNSAGIIIDYLNKKWDESFVLIFPLANIPEGYNRHDIEHAIGNLLIMNDIPVLDKYSHTY